MKLSFRGITYETQPSTVEIMEGGVGGKYRGNPWKVHLLKKRASHHASPRVMTYRGVTYVRD